MATISEVAQHLGVDRETVKTWTKEFAEHLSLTANPPKGKERQFGENDLRVLALVSYYWEDDPDLEYIHAMLNSGDYNEDVFAEFASLHTPVFQDVPDEINEDWTHGVLIGGMAERTLPQVGKAYKTAADELLKQALAKFEPHEIDYPIFFLYRHAIEVYLKAMLHTPPRTHDLERLIRLLEEQYGTKIAPCVKDRLWDFQRLDQQADLFRYAESPSGCELWIDFHHLKWVMDRLCEAFEQQIDKVSARQ
jgi:DNA-binding transcriptional MerR regulator